MEKLWENGHLLQGNIIYYILKEGQLTPIMINITIKVSTVIYSVDISWYMGTDIWTRIVISILFAIVKDGLFIHRGQVK